MPLINIHHGDTFEQMEILIHMSVLQLLSGMTLVKVTEVQL